MEYKRLTLKKGTEKRLKQGHAWVYSNEVDTKLSPIKSFDAGEQVVICASNGKELGTAVVSPTSLIFARLISRTPTQFLDQSLIVHRLKIALSIRQQVFQADCYRLVFGDSDGLPGLVVDRFGDTLVVQISQVGMELMKQDVIDALDKVCRPETIIVKNNGKMREAEGLESYVEFAKGECEEIRLVENGVDFVIPALTGQKTGWFYDHRMNRARMKDYVKGKRVLDLFSYVGGWGIQAAKFGAESVTCVDSSALALEYVTKNASLNGVEDKVDSIAGDVFEICRQLKEQDARFDVVIADPPAFIPRRKDQKAGEQAYQRLNHQAMRLLSKDGILVSASCSMHLGQDALVEVLRKTGRALEKNVQILEQGGQGADHPILPAIPETHYLKAIFARVLPAQ